MNTQKFRFARLLAGGLAVCLPLLGIAQPVATVRTQTESFSDAVLVSQTETHVFLKHARGVANVRIADLDNDTLAALGVKGFTATPANGNPAGAGEADASASFPGWSGPRLDWRVGLPEAGALPLPPRQLLWLIVAALLAGWGFICWCAKLICDKAGSPPGLLIWIPVLQMLPLLRAAGMSGWWLLGFLVPVFNIVAQVLWSLNIAKARGKGVLTGILLILPVTNLFAFLYLAFSRGAEPAEATAPARPVFRMEPLPSQ